MKMKLMIAVVASALTTAAYANSVYEESPGIDVQIRGAEMLAIIEIIDAGKRHVIEWNASGDAPKELVVTDMPFKVVDLLKGEPAEELMDSPVLRVAVNSDPKSSQPMAFPVKVGQMALVSLTADTLMPQKEGSAYAVKQETYHLLDGDSVQLLDNGKVIDKLTLDDIRQQVAVDAERLEKLEAMAEPEEVRQSTPPATVVGERVE